MKLLVSVKSVKKSNKLNIIVAKWDVVVYWWVLQILNSMSVRQCDLLNSSWNHVSLRDTPIS